MKSPILRSSFGSRTASGLKVLPLPSPRGITFAILQARSSTSKWVIRRAALRPLRSSLQPCSTPTPNGESRPMPVTTTRLIAVFSECWAIMASGRSLVDVLDGVADGQDRLGRVVRNLNAELFFESHDEFDRVQAVGAQIIDEAGAFGYLVGFDAEMFDNDLLDALCGVTHLGILVLNLSVFVSGT